MGNISETLLEIMEEAFPGFTKLVEEKLAGGDGEVFFGPLPVGSRFHDMDGDYIKVQPAIREDGFEYNAVRLDGEVAWVCTINATVTPGWQEFPVDRFKREAIEDFDGRKTTFADLEVGEWFRDEVGDLCQKAKPESGHHRDNCIVFRSDEKSGFCYDHEPHVPVTRVPNPLKGLL